MKTIILPIANIPENYVPDYARMNTSELGWKLLFSATRTEYAAWQFKMPEDYLPGSLVIKLIYTMTDATADKVNIGVEIMSLSDDAADPDVADFDNINELVGGTVVPDMTGKTDEINISCSNDDGAVAEDLVILRISRDHNDINDTAIGDFELRTVSFEYTHS